MSRKADHYKSEAFRGVFFARRCGEKFAAASSSKHILMMSTFIDRPIQPSFGKSIWRGVP